MAQNDTYNNNAVIISNEYINTISTGETKLGIAIDLQGYTACLFTGLLGELDNSADSAFEWRLEHADDAAFTVGVEIVPDDFSLGDSITVIPASTVLQANIVTKIGYVGGKRYVRLNAKAGDAGTTTLRSIASVNLGVPREAPVA